MTAPRNLYVLALFSALCHAIGADAAGYTFVSATDGTSCAGLCSQQGLTSATMRQANGPLQTSVCQAHVTGKGSVSGYQEGGSSTCNVVANSTALNVTDYSCLCLESMTQPGLATSDGSSCSSSCNQDIEGMTGSAVATESSDPSFTCVPKSEIGTSNRFGFTTDLDGTSICTAARDGSALATSDFSCFCTFQEAGSSQGVVAPASGSLTSASGSLGSDEEDATSVGGK